VIEYTPHLAPKKKHMMKTLNIFLSLMFTALFGFGQVTVQTNFPASIAPNSNLLIELKLSKGAIANFSKYQMDVPAGVTVTEGNSKTGNFSFEGNRAKIVWVSIPAEAEFYFSFNMKMGATAGPGVFNQRFFYVEDNGKKEVELDPINVTFDPAGATVAATMDPGGSSAGTNTTATANSDNTSNSNNTSVNSSNTETSANSNTTAPNNSDVASNTNTTSTNTSTEAAATETKTAKKELTFAEKLDAHHEKHSEPEEKTAKKIAEPVKAENKVITGNSSNSEEKNTENASGIVFKVQIGAFGSDPGKSKFSKAGKVTIINEGGKFKVLHGSFKTKEDAAAKLGELRGKGFDGFVVSYNNGVRVK